MADEQYKISLGVDVDTSGIQEQINTDIKNKIKPIQIDIDLNHTKKQIDTIKSQIQGLNKIKVNLGAGTGSSNGVKNIVKDANWAYKQMLDIQKRANSLKIKINGLDTSKNVNEVRELSSQLTRLKGDYESLRRTFGSQLSSVQFGNLQAEADETTAKLAAMDAKIKDTKANFAKRIELKLGDDGKLATQVAKIKSEADKLSNIPNDLRLKIKALDNAMDSMNLASEKGDIEGLIDAYRRYEQAIEGVNNQLKQNKLAEKANNDFDALEQNRRNLSLEMDSWLKSNSAAAKDFGGTIQQLKARIDACDATQLDGLKREFQSVKKEAQLAGKNTQTFGDQLKSQFEKYKSYISVATLVMWATQGLKDMFKQVVAIDSAMTELKKVTDETDASYNQFLSNAASRAKELGTTVEGLVASTADFARLGYGFEDSQGLAEVANIYAVVGDEINGVEDATKSLISTLAAFKDEASGISDTDFAMDIVDKFNEVSNNFAISSGGIGEALTRSASSMAAANNTLDESIALITAANTVVQDPDSVGTAFKTKFLNKNCLYVQKCA